MRRFPLWLKEERRCRNGTSRSCRRCYLVTVEEGCQEGAQKRKAEKEGEVDEGGEERRIRGQIVKEVVAGIQEKVSMDDGVKNDVKRGQLGKVSCEAGTAHRLKMKKRGGKLARRGSDGSTVG